MKLIGSYMNGNYKVSIFEDGTKIRENDLDYFSPNTVESMDIKITNCCDKGCKFCHEDSVPNGKHADILSPCFINKLHPYTELAIGGGNPLEHPDLVEFLLNCKDKKLIPSMTVNQVHFMQNLALLHRLCDNKLIYGLGISLVDPTADFIKEVKKFPNAVIHVIAGIFSKSDLMSLVFNNLKILILGYKRVRRGLDLYNIMNTSIEEKIYWLSTVLKKLADTEAFKCISFDNLAIVQMDVKKALQLSDEQWNNLYMGDDGQEEMTSASMYVDMVNKRFAKNSCAADTYPLMDTIEEMYNFLKSV